MKDLQPSDLGDDEEIPAGTSSGEHAEPEPEDR
jgi:hypothetical protein